MTDEEAWGRKPEEQRPLPLRDHASQVFVARVGETQILTKGPVSLGPLFICICRCSSFTAAGGGGQHRAGPTGLHTYLCRDLYIETGFHSEYLE